MARKYYTLVVFYKGEQRWVPEFGDFDPETVEDEKEEYIDLGLVRMITTGEDQADIDAAVTALNSK